MTSRSRGNGEGSIYPYRNGFAAYVWVRTPVGTRKRKYVYGRTREVVHDKWLTLHQRAREGPMVTQVPRVGEYLRYWLEEVVKPNRTPRTFGNYESFVRLYINPGVGEKRIDRLQLRDTQQWINRIAKRCQCCDQGKDAQRQEKKRRCCALGRCCREVLSARTIKDIRDCLRAALNQAIKDEVISRNVAALVTVPTVRKRKRNRWSTDEARAFLESAREDDDPLYAAYVLVLALGLRKGEVLGLTCDDVDVDSSELTIAWQLQRVGRQLLHRQTKTEESDSTLPLPSIAATALKLRDEQRSRDREDADDAWLETGLMFTTRYGTPIEPRNFNRSWDARCASAGIRKITVHDARRTCGSLLADLDVHPRVAMRILRHAQFAITMEIYTEVSSQVTRDALRKLGDSLDG